MNDAIYFSVKDIMWLSFAYKLPAYFLPENRKGQSIAFRRFSWKLFLSIVLSICTDMLATCIGHLLRAFQKYTCTAWCKGSRKVQSSFVWDYRAVFDCNHYSCSFLWPLGFPLMVFIDSFFICRVCLIIPVCLDFSVTYRQTMKCRT